MYNCYSKPISTGVGVRGFIKTLALAVEELATANAEAFGYGREAVANLGGFWVISKIRFSLLGYPESGEKLIAETWPLPPSKIKVERQYRIKNEGGEVLANGTSEWCILSCENRRPLRIESDVFSGGRRYITEQSGAGDFTRLRAEVSDSNFCYEREITAEDIDLNNHTNNKKYTEMVLECFSDEYLNSNPILVYELHFVKETMLGEKISVYKTETEQGVLVTGISGGNVVFRAGMEFFNGKN